MAPQKRESGTTVKERLFKEFYGFSFFKAVHLLETLFLDRKPVGQTLNPKEEAVRFSVKPGLTFPASDISGLKQADQKNPPEMDVAFMGLIGPSGVLPYWYNELAIERAREQDFAFTAFLDIFHHRLISLFYLAWKKYNLPVTYAAGARDRLSRHLLSLIGLGTPGLSGMIGLPEESLIFYGGLLSRQVPSAVAVEAAVQYFSGTNAAIDQFIERVIPLDPEDQTQVGSANSELGVSTVCGSYTRENQTKFRVNLGPLGYDRFVRFLPSGAMLRPIFSLTRFMAGIEYEFDIRLFLKREEVPLCTIGADTPGVPRLGWSTWLKTPDVVHAQNPYITFQETDL
jgi:type VI secretion system protein ImpH